MPLIMPSLRRAYQDDTVPIRKKKGGYVTVWPWKEEFNLYLNISRKCHFKHVCILGVHRGVCSFIASCHPGTLPALWAGTGCSMVHIVLGCLVQCMLVRGWMLSCSAEPLEAQAGVFVWPVWENGCWPPQNEWLSRSADHWYEHSSTKSLKEFSLLMNMLAMQP